MTTKTPWHVAQPSTTTDTGPQIAIAADAQSILGVAMVFGDSEDEAQENAALIVRAVNNHDALVDSLSWLIAATSLPEGIAPNCIGRLKAIEALAKAKES